MGLGSLRVWNDDEIAPNTGFPPHPHANMEIVTYVRKGAITHKDALGNQGRTLRPLLLRYINRLSDLLWLMAREAEN